MAESFRVQNVEENTKKNMFVCEHNIALKPFFSPPRKLEKGCDTALRVDQGEFYVRSTSPFHNTCANVILIYLFNEVQKFPPPLFTTQTDTQTNYLQYLENICHRYQLVCPQRSFS
jgi:hypothetical protein